MHTIRMMFVMMMIVAATGAFLGSSSVGQARTFRAATHDRGLKPERNSELMVFAQASNKNNVAVPNLNDVASEFETLAKGAIKGQSDPVANDLRNVAEAVHSLKGYVPPQTYRDLADRLSDMSDAQKNGNFEGVALAAAEGYRTMRLAENPADLPAPIAVYMLDYTALKTLALTRTDSPGWQRLAAIGDETANYWAESSPNIKQKALRSLMDTIIVGINTAMARENVSELRFATRLQLDAVDLLKNDFARKLS